MISESPCEPYWENFFKAKSPVLDLIMQMQSRDPLTRPTIETCLGRVSNCSDSLANHQRRFETLSKRLSQKMRLI